MQTGRIRARENAMTRASFVEWSRTALEAVGIWTPTEAAL